MGGEISKFGAWVLLGDITGKGTEIYLTSMADGAPSKSLTHPIYDDAPYEMGITAHRLYMAAMAKSSTGWHVAWRFFK